MKTNIKTFSMFFTLTLALWTQVFAGGSTDCFTIGDIITDPAFESKAERFLGSAENFRKTTGTITVEALENYKDFESYFSASYHSYVGKGFEAVYVDEFNKFTSGTEGLEKYSLESSASRGKPGDVTDLILREEIEPGKWKIIAKYQCKKSIQTASEALTDPKYAEEIILVPRDIYEQMKKMPQYAEYIKNGRLTCSIKGFWGVTTEHVETVMRDILRPVFILAKNIPDITISVIRALTDSEIGKTITVTSEAQASTTITVKTQIQTGETISLTDVLHQAKASGVSANIDFGKFLKQIKTVLKIAGPPIDIGLGSYFVVNDVRNFQAGQLDSDIYALKIAADSAMLTPGLIWISGKLLTLASVSFSIPEPVSKIAGVTALVAGIGLVAVDHMQAERVKDREYYFSVLETEEKHNAVETIILNTLLEE